MSTRVQDNDPDVEADDLSAPTLVVLCLLGGFLVLALLRSLRKLWWRPDRDAAERDGPEAGHLRQAEAATAQVKTPGPQKPGVSLKKLVKSSQQASSRHVAADKSVDHPLYINSIRAFHDGVTGISFSTTGRSLAATCEDRVLRVFSVEDLQSKNFSFKRRESLRDLVAVAFGAGHELFVLTKGGIGPAVLEKYSFNSDSSKGDPFSLLWEVKGVHGNKAGKGVRAGLNPHTSQKSLAMTFDSKDDMRLFDHDGSQLAAVSSSGLQNHDVAFSGSGRFFGAATFTSDVRLFEVQYTREGDFRRTAKVMDLKKAHNGQVLALAFSPDGHQVVTSSKDGTWAVWNINVRYVQDEDPKLLLKSEQETEDGERYQLLAFGPDNIVAAVAGNTLHFLDTKRGTVLEQIEEAHDGPITALHWSPVLHKLGPAKTGTAILATSSIDKRVRLWRAPRL